MKKIRKAVVLAAGFGTRFLPASKAVPKEMLPIVDKPVIQYVVEELVGAGIEQIILVTNCHKRAIEDHFDHYFELENKLENSGKTDQLEQIRKISDMAEFVYVRQKEMNGTGGAMLTAKNIVGDEPFVVLFGDDFMVATPSRTKQLIEAYVKFESIILGGINDKNPDDATKYAFAKGEDVGNNTVKIETLIEKPGVENKPSDLAIVSGFVFPPEIFEALESCQTEKGRELGYVDGVNELKNRGMDAYALEIQNARYYDCGNVIEYLKTNVEIALARDDIKDEFGKYIKDIAAKI
jgi:UTP--glucose-1-phosphate uridylyltransferase